MPTLRGTGWYWPGQWWRPGGQGYLPILWQNSSVDRSAARIPPRPLCSPQVCGDNHTCCNTRIAAAWAYQRSCLSCGIFNVLKLCVCAVAYVKMESYAVHDVYELYYWFLVSTFHRRLCPFVLLSCNIPFGLSHRTDCPVIYGTGRRGSGSLWRTDLLAVNLNKKQYLNQKIVQVYWWQSRFSVLVIGRESYLT